MSAARRAIGQLLEVRVPDEAEMIAIDRHLAGRVVGHLGIFKEAADAERMKHALRDDAHPEVAARVLRERGRPIYASAVLENELRRLARLSVLPIPKSPGRPISRAEGYGFIMARSGPAAPANSPLRRMWHEMIRASGQFVSATIARRLDPQIDSHRVSSVKAVERTPIVTKSRRRQPRGLTLQRNELARAILLERKIWNEPVQPEEIREITDVQAEQIPRIAREEYARDPGNGTSDTKQRQLSKALRRVTGRA